MTNSGQPIFRVERLPHIRELYEQQQDEIVDVPPEKAIDYKVGDEVVVDLPTRTIEGKIGYVGETDVRIDTSAHGQSWDNEVVNKQQFEEGLRQNEQVTTQPDDTVKTVAIYPAEENRMPYDIVIQTIGSKSPALDAVEPERSTLELAGNFHITDDNIGEGGPKQKFARNIAAIETLFKLESENRNATSEEQEILSNYVGWGGLADAFDPDKGNWAQEYQTLKNLLSEDEYVLGKRRVTKESFERWYASQTDYRTVEDQELDADIMASTYGLPEMARMLGVHRQTIYYIVANEDFELIKVGRYKRATKESFEKWYHNQTRYQLAEDRQERS